MEGNSFLEQKWYWFELVDHSLYSPVLVHLTTSHSPIQKTPHLISNAADFFDEQDESFNNGIEALQH